MRINKADKQIEMEQRDLNFILPAYVRSYLFYAKNEDPVRIIFPMYTSVPHPLKAGVMIPVEFVPPDSPIAIDIIEDGKSVPDENEVPVEKVIETRPSFEQMVGKVEQPEVGDHVEEQKLVGKPFSNDPPPNRVPKQPAHPATGTPDSMGSRLSGDETLLRKELSIGDGDPPDAGREIPYDKKISKGADGSIEVED